MQAVEAAGLKERQTEKWDWQLLLDHGMPPCDWGDAVTVLFVRQNEFKNHFALESEDMN